MGGPDEPDYDGEFETGRRTLPLARQPRRRAFEALQQALELGHLGGRETGRRLHAEIAPLALAYEAALLAGLAPAEVAQLKRLLQRLEGAAARLSGEG